MVPFKGENADYAVQGYVSLPEMTRASRNYMTTIVNGRWIQSYAINRAVLDAFHTFLPIGRYPIAVINVEGDPFLTDVNVHPSKQQIRMSKEGELLTLIKESIHKAIQKNVIVPGVTKKETVPKKPSEQVRFWESPPRQEPPTEKFRAPVQQPANNPTPLYEKDVNKPVRNPIGRLTSRFLRRK